MAAMADERIQPDQIIERFQKALGNKVLEGIIIIAETRDMDDGMSYLHVHADTITARWRKMGMLHAAAIDLDQEWVNVNPITEGGDD